MKLSSMLSLKIVFKLKFLKTFEDKLFFEQSIRIKISVEFQKSIFFRNLNKYVISIALVLVFHSLNLMIWNKIFVLNNIFAFIDCVQIGKSLKVIEKFSICIYCKNAFIFGIPERINTFLKYNLLPNYSTKPNQKIITFLQIKIL